MVSAISSGKGPWLKIKRKFQKPDPAKCRSAADNEHATESREFRYHDRLIFQEAFKFAVTFLVRRMDELKSERIRLEIQRQIDQVPTTLPFSVGMLY